LKLKSCGILNIAPTHFALSVNHVLITGEKKEEKQAQGGWKEYFEKSKELIKADGGPPRWFSRLECLLAELVLVSLLVRLKNKGADCSCVVLSIY